MRSDQDLDTKSELKIARLICLRAGGGFPLLPNFLLVDTYAMLSRVSCGGTALIAEEDDEAAVKGIVGQILDAVGNVYVAEGRAVGKGSGADGMNAVRDNDGIGVDSPEGFILNDGKVCGESENIFGIGIVRADEQGDGDLRSDGRAAPADHAAVAVAVGGFVHREFKFTVCGACFSTVHPGSPAVGASLPLEGATIAKAARDYATFLIFLAGHDVRLGCGIVDFPLEGGDVTGGRMVGDIGDRDLVAGHGFGSNRIVTPVLQGNPREGRSPVVIASDVEDISGAFTVIH